MVKAVSSNVSFFRILISIGLTFHVQVRSRSRKINFKSRIAVRHANFDFGDEQALDYNEVQEAGQQAQDKPDHVETGVDKEEESVSADPPLPHLK